MKTLKLVKQKRINKLLIEGYKEMAEESLKITREFERLPIKSKCESNEK